MRSTFRSILAIVFCCTAALCLQAGRPSQLEKKLLYIMIDGFRYDYVEMQSPEDLPGFTSFLNEGVRAKWMTSIFPTVSYPNYRTLVTGLFAESHGVVGNYIYDAEEKDYFHSYEDDTLTKQKWWNKAEPIWTTATKARRKTAAILWSRCDVPFDGVTLDYCEPYALSTDTDSFKNNIDKALEKLEADYDFAMVYTEYIDMVGHLSGPETEVIKGAVKEVDAIILHLQEQLRTRNLRDKVNVVIVSDHGMVNTASGAANRVELDEYLPLQYIEKIVDAGATSNIKVFPGHIDEVYESAKRMPGVEVYRHDEIPEHLHFKNNKYIHDILIKADIGTFLMKSRTAAKMLPERNFGIMPLGSHGYDPDEEKMRAIFFAKGPDFHSGEVIEPIRSVDVYPLLAHLLGITPRPNNGTLSATAAALEAPTASSAHSNSIFFILLFICQLLPLILGCI